MLDGDWNIPGIALARETFGGERMFGGDTLLGEGRLLPARFSYSTVEFVTKIHLFDCSLKTLTLWQHASHHQAS